MMAPMQPGTVFEQFLKRRRVQMTPHARVLHACVRLACLGVTGGEERPSPAAAAALPPADRVNDLRAALATVTDWDALREAAVDHGLAALLYRQISAFCPQSVPPAPLEALKSLYLASTQRALRMTRQLVLVLAALESAGIRMLPLKGPVLSQSAFGDPSLRHFVDLDVLVRPGDGPAARGRVNRDLRAVPWQAQEGGRR